MAFKISLQHALRGLGRAARTEPNIRWQLFLTVLAFSLGLLFQLSRGEWLLIIVVVGLVLAMELVNTALEKTLDIIKPRFDEQVGRIKDIMAGAVLIASLVALASGILVFWPHLFRV